MPVEIMVRLIGSRIKQHLRIISPALASEYSTRPTSSPSTKNSGMRVQAIKTVVESPRSIFFAICLKRLR